MLFILKHLNLDLPKGPAVYGVKHANNSEVGCKCSYGWTKGIIAQVSCIDDRHHHLVEGRSIKFEVCRVRRVTGDFCLDVLDLQKLH